MKYIYLIVIIFLLTSCTNSQKKDTQDYDYIPNNSIRFIRTEDETSILINKDDIYYLLLLNSQNIDIDVNYLVKYKNVETNIKAKEQYILNKNLVINDIEFKLNNKIEINMLDENICIYIQELDKNDYSECDYIYLYNANKNIYITLNSEISVLFYHSYTKFTYKFLHHLCTIWIDSYTIDTSSYITLTLYEDDFNVTSGKIRNKTIHKK